MILYNNTRCKEALQRVVVTGEDYDPAVTIDIFLRYSTIKMRKQLSHNCRAAICPIRGRGLGSRILSSCVPCFFVLDQLVRKGDSTHAAKESSFAFFIFSDLND